MYGKHPMGAEALPAPIPAGLSRVELARHVRRVATAYQRLLYAARRWEVLKSSITGLASDQAVRGITGLEEAQAVRGWETMVTDMVAGAEAGETAMAAGSAKMLQDWADDVLRREDRTP